MKGRSNCVGDHNAGFPRAEDALRKQLEQLDSVANEMLSGLSAGSKIRSRALFNASLMDRVPESAGQMLYSVRADGALRHRILTVAHRTGFKESLLDRLDRVGTSRSRARVMRRLTPIMGMAMALVLTIGLGAKFLGFGAFEPNLMSAPPIQSANEAVLKTQTFQAGGVSSSAWTMSSGIPQYRSLFDSADDGEPALLSVNGRYYQMLAAPQTLPSELLGAKHGDVQPLTADISLADRIGVLSNVVPEGEVVYAVQDFSTRTMVAARVGGTMRLFQRVGYAAKSTIGEERFKDTLAIDGHVRALELSGVGVVSDADAVSELVAILLSDARTWSGETIPDDAQALTIYLDNSLALQLNVSGDLLEACGAWSCPQFFEAFGEAVTM